MHQLTKSRLGYAAASIFFIVAGLGLLWYATFSYQETNRLLAGGSTTGKVTEIVAHRDTRRGKRTFAPKVEFTTTDKQSIVFESKFRTSANSYDVGDEVPVVYDPKNPNNARINSFWGLWGGAILGVIVGGSFVAGGILTAVVAKRGRTLGADPQSIG